MFVSLWLANWLLPSTIVEQEPSFNIEDRQLNRKINIHGYELSEAGWMRSDRVGGVSRGVVLPNMEHAVDVYSPCRLEAWIGGGWEIRDREDGREHCGDIRKRSAFGWKGKREREREREKERERKGEEERGREKGYYNIPMSPLYVTVKWTYEPLWKWHWWLILVVGRECIYSSMQHSYWETSIDRQCPASTTSTTKFIIAFFRFTITRGPFSIMPHNSQIALIGYTSLHLVYIS